MGTAVPAMVADGHSAALLAGTSGTFAVLVCACMLRAIPAEHYDEAAVWLANFFGSYIGDVTTAAIASAAG